MATLLETLMRKYTIPCRIWFNDDIEAWKSPYSFSFYIDIIYATPTIGTLKAFYKCRYSISNSSIKIIESSKNHNLKFYNNRLIVDAKGNLSYLTGTRPKLAPLIDLKDIPRFFTKLLTQSCFKTPISNMNEFIGAIHKCREEIIHDILSPQELTKVGQYIRKSHE